MYFRDRILVLFLSSWIPIGKDRKKWSAFSHWAVRLKREFGPGCTRARGGGSSSHAQHHGLQPALGAGSTQRRQGKWSWTGSYYLSTLISMASLPSKNLGQIQSEASSSDWSQSDRQRSRSRSMAKQPLKWGVWSIVLSYTIKVNWSHIHCFTITKSGSRTNWSTRIWIRSAVALEQTNQVQWTKTSEERKKGL